MDTTEQGDLMKELQRLQEENQEYRRRLETPTASTAPTVLSTTPIESNRPRHRLPHLHKYSGKREEWSQWNVAARMKLQTDSEAIGSLADQATYLYMAMEGEPQTRICYWVENIVGTSEFTPIALLA